MDKWKIMHDYRRAARAELVEHLLCPLCTVILIPAIDDEVEPYLKCFACQTAYRLEDAFFEEMVRVLEEAERLR